MDFKELLESLKDGTDEPLIVFKHSEFKSICPYRILGSDYCTEGGFGKACSPNRCCYVNAKFDSSPR